MPDVIPVRIVSLSASDRLRPPTEISWSMRGTTALSARLRDLLSWGRTLDLCRLPLSAKDRRQFTLSGPLAFQRLDPGPVCGHVLLRRVQGGTEAIKFALVPLAFGSSFLLHGR